MAKLAIAKRGTFAQLNSENMLRSLGTVSIAENIRESEAVKRNTALYELKRIDAVHRHQDADQ